MKALLLASVLLLLSGEALASGAAWHRKRIPVHDQAASVWEPYLRVAVARINRMNPRSVPRLVYRPHESECNPRRRGITVCSREGNYSGVTYARWKTPLRRATILLDPDDNASAERLGGYTYLALACHELMHAVTGAPERKVRDGQPCPYNAAFARKVYREHGRR